MAATSSQTPPRATRIGGPDRRWLIATLTIAALVLAPLGALGVIAISSTGALWVHLLTTVLPRAAWTTAQLMAGTALVTVVIGTATAWIVAMYRFPGRAIFDWLLLLPIAIPTYVAAYAYVEIFDYSGIVQETLRFVFGWVDRRDYWFPDIRSLPGAVFVLSAVLYPYVYLTARAAFSMQSMHALDVARTLGCSAASSFWRVALPLARPAIIAGVTLVMMECINDIGAVEFFGVNTLTVTAFSTWLARNNLAGAAQLSLVMLIIVFAMIGLERWARRQRRYDHRSGERKRPRTTLTAGQSAIAMILCTLPVLVGFVAPAALLVSNALPRMGDDLDGRYIQLAVNSFGLSVVAAVLAVGLGLVLAYGARLSRHPGVATAGRLASVGYAVPGTILAIGILIPLAAFDNAVDAAMRAAFGISTGLLISGSAAIIVIAYVIRFLAVSHGALEAGLLKIRPNLDMAARTLGRTPGQTLLAVHLPLLRPAALTAGLLVFVDSMKELPATILLRPFGFDTLATHVYTYASLEAFEDASLAALTIVVVGLIPVIILSRVAQPADTLSP